MAQLFCAWKEDFFFTNNTYSPGDSDQSNSKSGFNFGDKKAFSYDIEDQVERMIAKMKRADLVNFSEDWKVNTITILLRSVGMFKIALFQLITISIGQNDLCLLTCNRNSSQIHGIQTADIFAKNLQRALDKLVKDVPRAYVNLILPQGDGFVLSVSLIFFDVPSSSRSEVKSAPWESQVSVKKQWSIILQIPV